MFVSIQLISLGSRDTLTLLSRNFEGKSSEWFMLPPEHLDSYRLDRYRTYFNLPRSVKLAISPLDRTLLISAPAERLERLQKRRVDLRIEAWFVAAATQISLCCENDLIYTAPTRLLETIAELESITAHTEDNPMVATATRPTAARRSASKETPSQPTVSSIPTVRSLATIALNAGMTEAAIASEIVGLGELAFLDADTNTYKASESGISLWADGWLDRDRETRKAQLFQVGSTKGNGKVEAAPDSQELPPEHQGSGEAPAPKAKKIRFKDFVIAASYSKTVGNFLEAQGYSAEERTAIVEQIAGLPTKEAAGDDLPEQIMARILGKYPALTRTEARRSLIRAVKKDMLGKPPIELDATATTDAAE